MIAKIGLVVILAALAIAGAWRLIDGVKKGQLPSISGIWVDRDHDRLGFWLTAALLGMVVGALAYVVFGICSGSILAP